MSTEPETYLATLHETSRELLAAETAEEIAEIAVRAADETLGLPAVALYRYDESADALVPAAYTERTRSLFGDLPTFEPGNSIAWKVYEEGTSRLVEDVGANEDAYNPATPVESELLVPLAEYGLFLSGSTTAGAFDEDDLQFAETLARSTAAALDRASREAELRARKRELERYETIVWAAGAPIVSLDADGNLVDVNEATVDLTGYDRDALVGAHFSTLVEDGDYERVEETLSGLLVGGDDTVEFTIGTADGERRQCVASLVVQPFETEYRGAIAVVRDVTDSRQREQRLAVMDRILRHNLRNEMNVVRGRAEILQSIVDRDAREHVDEIVASAETLLSLSEDARKFHQSFRTDGDSVVATDLIDAVTSSIAEYRERYPDAEVRIDAPESAPIRAHEALHVCVDELVENAIVHNDRDHPTVRIRVSADGDRTTLAVADDGPGMPAVERATIEGGTESALDHASGLGLWLVKWIADSSGADLEAEPNDPHGTVVRIRFRSA